MRGFSKHVPMMFGKPGQTRPEKILHKDRQHGPEEADSCEGEGGIAGWQRSLFV